MNHTLWLRQTVAVALALLLAPFVPIGLYAQGPPPGGYAPLDAMQLDQLVAPVALYPDALVAQVLTAATYADQVNDADNWLHQSGGMPPDQLAGAVNGMPWDPSVKALAEFPSVLDNMARNSGWTAALGNAYYNQPGDVMNAVQAMRYQAQEAGSLRNTRQQRVFYNGGLIEIMPVNPGMVYVPYYNPWGVYGAPINPWGGYYWAAPRGVSLGTGLAIGFGAGIGIGLFTHFGWGYSAWSPNWRGGVVVYNHNTYISRSPTVINQGRFGAYNRGVFEHEGRGVPAGNYRPAVTSQTAVFGRPEAGGPARPAEGYRPAPAGVNRPEMAQPNRQPAGVNRPEMAQPNRPEVAQPNRPEVAQPNRPEVAQPNRQPAGANRPEMAQPNRPEMAQPNRPPAGANRPEMAQPNRGQQVAPKAAPKAPAKPAPKEERKEPPRDR